MNKIRIEDITPKETLDIRHRVLWPNKTKAHCIVDGDEDANHYGAYLGNVLVGVASTYELEGSVRLRKFAVEKQHQGKGVGSKLFKHALCFMQLKAVHQYSGVTLERMRWSSIDNLG